MTILNLALPRHPSGPSALASVEDILKQPSLDKRKAALRARISEHPFSDIDPGVFDDELVRLGIYVKPHPDGLEKKPIEGHGNIIEGTYAGTQAAITHAYKRIERRSVCAKVQENKLSYQRANETKL